jgi:hypothetical protein
METTERGVDAAERGVARGEGGFDRRGDRFRE